jgi:hypothetical protein
MYDACRPIRCLLFQSDRDQAESSTALTSGYNGTAFAVKPAHPATADATALAATIIPSGPELLVLLFELKNLRTTTHTPDVPPTKPTFPAKPTTVQRGYCWTHGSTVEVGHTSANCKNKVTGKIDSAMWRNQQGVNPNPFSRRTAAAP